MQNIRRTHGFEPLTIEGSIPDELRGTLYRTGPGIFERFGKRVHHAFEADGVVSAVRFGPDGAFGAARVVESRGYLEEEEAGRFLYNFSAGYLDFIKANRRGPKTSGNTAIFYWQDRLFALMEGGKPQEMDPATLDTWEHVDFDGVIKGAFSAHPHYVSSLNTHFNFGLRYGRKMVVDFYSLPQNGPIKRLGSFEAPWATMVHDFAATEKHLIFIIAPARLVTWRALTRIGGISKLFKWEPRLGCQIIRVPLATPEKIQRFDLDPFWLWHTVNAQETPRGTAVDICAYTRPEIDAIGTDSPDMPNPYLERLILDEHKAERHRLWDMPCEFPVVPDALHGQSYDRAFFQVLRDGHHGLSSYVLSTGREDFWPTPQGHEPSEPIFVPRAGDNLRGWLLSLVKDRNKSQSYLAILDSERVAHGPVAKVFFSQEIPLTFHGSWVDEPRN